jgi:hypothetical protein
MVFVVISYVSSSGNKRMGVCVGTTASLCVGGAKQGGGCIRKGSNRGRSNKS